VTVGNSNEYSEALVYLVMGRWWSDVIGGKDGEW